MRFLIILLLLSCQQLQAQQDPTSQLKQQLEESEGAVYVVIALELSKVLRNESAYEEAAEFAHKAYLEAANQLDAKQMAHALNQEAKALLLIEEGEENDHQLLAAKRLRESQKLIRKYQLNEFELEEKNRMLLKESRDPLGLKSGLVEVSKVLGMAWDSVVAEIAKLDDEPSFSFDTLEFSDPKGPSEEEIHNLREQRRREAHDKSKFVQQIIQLNKKNFEREIKSMVHLDDVDSLELAGITVKKLEDLGKVWGVEKDKIERDLVFEERKINRLNAVQAREQLLLAQYKSRFDSLNYMHTVDSLNIAKQQIDLAQRETELKRKELQQKLSSVVSGGSSLLFILLLFGYFRVRKSNKVLSEKNKQIEDEQERSEELLLNILPAEVADELKQFGAAQAHHYDNVSVLFADFQNFSLIAEKMNPSQLVADLDHCFKAFDQITDKYNLEKIKTIGDAYMCAGGLPTPDSENSTKAVLAALDMQSFLDQWKEKRINEGQPYFEARIGIHTGSIVAGVVGVKKFAYDIWGDTVNIASRMEANSEAGQVNISSATYELVKDQFRFKYRGKFHAKNKGEIDMYFVERIQAHESIPELV